MYVHVHIDAKHDDTWYSCSTCSCRYLREPRQRVASLTQQVSAEAVPAEVVKHGSEHGQQHHVDVVQASRAAGDRACEQTDM